MTDTKVYLVLRERAIPEWLTSSPFPYEVRLEVTDCLSFSGRYAMLRARHNLCDDICAYCRTHIGHPGDKWSSDRSCWKIVFHAQSDAFAVKLLFG